MVDINRIAHEVNHDINNQVIDLLKDKVRGKDLAITLLEAIQANLTTKIQELTAEGN